MFGRTCDIKRKMYRPALIITHLSARVGFCTSGPQSGVKC